MAYEESHVEFSDEDVRDLQNLGVTAGDVPEFHPILQVWKEILSNLPAQVDEKITPQYAMRICQSYPQLTFADMNKVRDAWHSKMEQFRQVLLGVIASDEECFVPSSPEEDKAENSRHYRTLLLEWQKLLLSWELAWDCESDDAAVEIAATAEVHRFFFSETGLTAHLQNIQFEYTEADMAAVQQELEEMKGGDSE